MRIALVAREHDRIRVGEVDAAEFARRDATAIQRVGEFLVKCFTAARRIGVHRGDAVLTSLLTTRRIHIQGQCASVCGIPLQVNAESIAVGGGRLVLGTRLKPGMRLVVQIGIAAYCRARDESVLDRPVADGAIGFILVDAADRNTLALVVTIEFGTEVVDLRPNLVVRLENDGAHNTGALVSTGAPLPLEGTRNALFGTVAVNIATAVTKLVVGATAREDESVRLIKEGVTDRDADFVVCEFALV